MVSSFNVIIITLCTAIQVQCLTAEGSYFEEQSSKYGHPPQKYDVVTEDGFVLTLYHLPGDGKRKIPVLLTHGMLCSADTWILRGNASIPITLANAGYDVWLGNTRGNRYSRRHISLDPNLDKSFWNFTFHEQAIYDLAATIDTVLEKSGAAKINALGHSLGNTLFYVLGAMKPEYNEKVNFLIALSPVCYLHNIVSPVQTILSLKPVIKEIRKQFNIEEIFGAGLFKGLLKFFCNAPVIAYTLCIENLLFSFTGSDSVEIGPDFLPLLTNHFPTSTSLKNILHLGQVYDTESFAQYDYGSRKNRFIYNSSRPLIYDLDKVKMPIALISAKNDRLSTLSDVDILRSKLPNVVSDLVIPKEKFNHVDYIWGENTNTYLHPYILSLLEKYS